jgi:hypothetical protein
MILNADDRLVNGFFVASSRRFIDETLDGLQVRHHATLDSRISRALAAWMAIQKDMLMPLSSSNLTAQVIRRRSYLADSLTHIAYSSKAAMSSNQRNIRPDQTLRLLFFTALTAAILLCAAVTPNSYIFLLGAPFLGFVLLMSVQLASTGGYSWTDRANLLLLLPFEPVLASLHAAAQSIPNALRKRRLPLRDRSRFITKRSTV